MIADITKCGGIWQAFQLLETSVNLSKFDEVSSFQCGVNCPFQDKISRLFEAPQELLFHCLSLGLEISSEGFRLLLD